MGHMRSVRPRSLPAALLALAAMVACSDPPAAPADVDENVDAAVVDAATGPKAHDAAVPSDHGSADALPTADVAAADAASPTLPDAADAASVPVVGDLPWPEANAIVA